MLGRCRVPWEGAVIHIHHMPAVAAWKNLGVWTGQGHALCCTESPWEGWTSARAAFQGIGLSLSSAACSEWNPDQAWSPSGHCLFLLSSCCENKTLCTVEVTTPCARQKFLLQTRCLDSGFAGVNPHGWVLQFKNVIS